MNSQSIARLLNLKPTPTVRKPLITLGFTVAFGLITHIGAITGWVVNWDVLSIGMVFDYSQLISQGKPLFGFVAKLLGGVRVGSLVSVQAIIFIALSAVIVVSMLDIKNTLCACLVGGVMITFPSVMTTFAYDSENVFFFAMLLSVCATAFIRRGRFCILPGIALLTASILVYQAYIGFATGLLMFFCIQDLMDGEKQLRRIVIQGFMYMGAIVVSCALYYGILQIVLHTTNMELSSYRGIDTLGQLQMDSIVDIIKATYLKPVNFFLKDAYGSSEILNFSKLYTAVSIIFLAYTVYFVFLRKTYKAPVRLLFIGLLVASLPFGLHLVGLLGQNANTHWLMIYSFCLIFIFVLKYIDCHFEMLLANSPDFNSIRRLVPIIAPAFVVILICVQLFQWNVLTHVGYTRTKLGYEANASMATQIITAVTASDDYHGPETEVMVIGKLGFEQTDVLSFMEPYTGISGGNNFNYGRIYYQLMEDYFRIYYLEPSGEAWTTIPASDEFSSMPHYPYSGYVQTIDGIIVVKMSG